MVSLVGILVGLNIDVARHIFVVLLYSGRLNWRRF